MFRRFVMVFLFLFISVLPVCANENFELITYINQDYNSSSKNELVQFKTIKKVVLNGNLVIPQRSIITADVIETQKERRWHKSGFILCKLKSFETEFNEKKDITEENIYVLAKKYEPINKKEASILATEIVLTQAASFFAPGVDILYFFTKGAIKRDKSYNWFKAGVSNAYENSICWFWLKGKPIDLSQGQTVELKGVEEKRAFQLRDEVFLRNWNKNRLNDQKMVKKNFIKSEDEVREDSLRISEEISGEREKFVDIPIEIKLRTKSERTLPSHLFSVESI